MNGYQRIAAALRGERSDRIPVMLHNFMMAAYEAGVSMAEFRSDPRAIARSFIEAVEKYDYDGIVVDVDTATLAGAAGVPIDAPPDAPARARGALLRSLEEAADLAPADIAGYPGVQVWLEAASILRRYFGNDVLIRGNCDQCPFSLAGMLRGMEDWMADLLDPDREEEAHLLLEHCTSITIRFVELMAATGAHMISNGDSPAGPDLVSPSVYRRFALPYERRVVRRAHQLGLPYALHICGNTGPILEDMLATRADALELDFKTDSTLAHAALHERAVFIGNIDPSGVLAMGTPAEVQAATRALLALFVDTPRFVLNAGCAIPPGTPPENLRALIRTAREFRG